MTNETETPCCEYTPVVETQFGGEEGQSASEAVLEAVAAVDGSSATDLPILHETLDPGALDQLFAERGRPSQPSKSVQFSYAGWKVLIRGDGTIQVCDPNRPTERA